MQDTIQAWSLDDLVKGALLGDVGHDSCLQLVLAQVGMGIVDLLGLVLRSDRGHDRIATCE